MASELPNREGWMTGVLASKPACPPFPEFTDFELKALTCIAKSFRSDAEAFLRQVRCSEVVDRIDTVVGFYTRVKVDRSACQPLEFNGKGAQCVVEGIKWGLCVLLYDEEGFLETIEGVTNGDDSLGVQQLSDLKFVSILPDEDWRS